MKNKKKFDTMMKNIPVRTSETGGKGEDTSFFRAASTMDAHMQRHIKPLEVRTGTRQVRYEDGSSEYAPKGAQQVTKKGKRKPLKHGGMYLKGAIDYARTKSL